MYPEHERLKSVHPESQTIGEFLDWLQNEKGITLATYEDDYYEGHILMPVRKPIDRWLAEYFDIDLDLIEREKRLMLDEQRRLNAALET